MLTEDMIENQMPKILLRPKTKISADSNITVSTAESSPLNRPSKILERSFEFDNLDIIIEIDTPVNTSSNSVSDTMSMSQGYNTTKNINIYDVTPHTTSHTDLKSYSIINHKRPSRHQSTSQVNNL